MEFLLTGQEQQGQQQRGPAALSPHGGPQRTCETDREKVNQHGGYEEIFEAGLVAALAPRAPAKVRVLGSIPAG